MSCFICSKKEKSVLAWIIMQNRKPQGGTHYCELFNVASELSFVNVQSVNARYGLRGKRYKFGEDDFKNLDFDAIPVAQKAKLIDCYLYQCDEHPRLDKLAIINELKAIRKTLVFNSWDYERSEWGIDDIPLKVLQEYKPITKTSSRFSSR